MALSKAVIEQHISMWSQRLSQSGHSYRKHWPPRLFHHAPVDTAVAILSDGYFRSRNDPLRVLLQDVAAGGVIANRQEAHGSVRLYFRPRTPTQFHIEGIRKDDECKYGPSAHAPVLVMFVLDAKKVFSLADVAFSNQNMQNSGAKHGSDDSFFESIPFDSVYHEGGTGGDNSIIASRCAEVLVRSPLQVNDVLTGICFRSAPERDMFLFRLGSDASQWRAYCTISEEIKVFDKRYSFVNTVTLSSEGVNFRINNRHDLKAIAISIVVIDSKGRQLINFSNSDFQPHNSSGGKWIFKRALSPDVYSVEVKLEGHVGFEGQIELRDTLL